jgi:hypothetical protein
MVVVYWALTGQHAAHRPGDRHSMRRLGRWLGSGKAREGRIGRSCTSWSPTLGQPVDHLRVVPACLLTRQHPGKGLGCPIRHWHRKDPLGVPTAARARRSGRGRAHGHPLLEAAAVAAAVLVGGHATLQGCNGRRRRDRKPVLCRHAPIVKGSRHLRRRRPTLARPLPCPHPLGARVLLVETQPETRWRAAKPCPRGEDPRKWWRSPGSPLDGAAPYQKIKRPAPTSSSVPQPGALLRLAGAMLVEAHDEWQVSDRRYSSEG